MGLGLRAVGFGEKETLRILEGERSNKSGATVPRSRI